MSIENIFVNLFTDAAESYLQEFYDADEAWSAIKELRRRNKRWNRHISVYTDIECITEKELRKRIKEWFAEWESEADAVRNMYFPNDEDRGDAEGDFLTREF